jgi:hypothetical protein
MSDLMIDIETLSIKPNAVVLTLGAVQFDPFSPVETFFSETYFRFDIEEQLDLDRDVNEDTIEWWGKQSDESKLEALTDEGRVKFSEYSAILTKLVVNSKRVWAQGPTFDMCILENLYRQKSTPIPWQYYNVRDSRTLLQALGDSRNAGAKAHNALEDCKEQIRAIKRVVSKFNLTTL